MRELDSKLRRASLHKQEKYVEYEMMLKNKSKKAMEKFKTEPYQLKYRREHGNDK